MSRTNGQHVQFKPHPLAEILPLMSDTELAGLEADVRAARRFTDPAVLYQGMILDGRNRSIIAERTGIPLPTHQFEGNDEDALAFVKSKAQHRHMTESQKGCYGANLVSLYEGRNHRPKKQPHVRLLNGKSCEIAALAAGTSRPTVERAVALKKASPAAFAECFNGKLPLHKALRQAQRQKKQRALRELERRRTVSLNDCRIIVGDSVRLLRPGGPIEDESINLLFADPPYNIGERYHGYDDDLPEDAYLGEMEEVIGLIPRCLAPGGSVFVMISSRYSDQFGMMLREAGLHRQDTIIWAESFGAHNPRFWTDSYRPIHHYTKHPTKFTFHHDDTRIYIPSWRNENGDGRQDEDGKLPGNVWGVWTDRRVARVVDNHPERIPDRIAPNQLPVALVERIVLAASNPGDLVLDPFHGTGTTARASLAHGRRYVGIEIDPEVAKRSRTWIKAYLAGRAK